MKDTENNCNKQINLIIEQKSKQGIIERQVIRSIALIIYSYT